MSLGSRRLVSGLLRIMQMARTVTFYVVFTMLALHLQAMTGEIGTLVSAAIDSLLNKIPATGASPRPSVELDMRDELNALTLRIIGQAAFGTNLETYSTVGATSGESAYAMMARLTRNKIDSFFSVMGLLKMAFEGVLDLSWLPSVPTKAQREQARAIALLRGSLLDVVTKRAARRAEERKAGSEIAETTLLIDFLLDAADSLPSSVGVVDSDASMRHKAPVTPLSLIEVLDEVRSSSNRRPVEV